MITLEDLVPPELHELFNDDPVVHRCFQNAVIREHTREQALVAIVLHLAETKLELKAELLKLHREGLPDIVIDGVRHVHKSKRDGPPERCPHNRVDNRDGEGTVCDYCGGRA